MNRQIERIIVKEISLLGIHYDLYRRGDMLQKKPNCEYEKLTVSMSAPEWEQHLTAKGVSFQKALDYIWLCHSYRHKENTRAKEKDESRRNDVLELIKAEQGEYK